MALTPYPKLSIEAITNLIRITKAKTFVEEKVLFASSSWNLAGSVLSIVVGELPQADALPAELTELKTALTQMQAGEAMPVWLPLLVDLLLKLLRELLPD